jgi:biotin carboxyl carrier protein
MRRALIALPVIAVVAAVVWWLGRPKPIPVVLTEIGRGRVEATIANTRAGTVEACQRTKLSTIIGGRIEVLTVKEGDKVKKGDQVCVIEAMKMKTMVAADNDGTVRNIQVKVGDAVDAGQVLMTIG